MPKYLRTSVIEPLLQSSMDITRRMVDAGTFCIVAGAKSTGDEFVLCMTATDRLLQGGFDRTGRRFTFT